MNRQYKRAFIACAALFGIGAVQVLVPFFMYGPDLLKHPGVPDVATAIVGVAMMAVALWMMAWIELHRRREAKERREKRAKEKRTETGGKRPEKKGDFFHDSGRTEG